MMRYDILILLAVAALTAAQPTGDKYAEFTERMRPHADTGVWARVGLCSKW